MYARERIFFITLKNKVCHFGRLGCQHVFVLSGKNVFLETYCSMVLEREWLHSCMYVCMYHGYISSSVHGLGHTDVFVCFHKYTHVYASTTVDIFTFSYAYMRAGMRQMPVRLVEVCCSDWYAVFDLSAWLILAYRYVYVYV